MPDEENTNPLEDLNTTHAGRPPAHKEYYKPAGNGGTYWQLHQKEWISLGRPLLETSLKMRGYSPFIEKDSTDVVSELEKKVYDISAHQRVCYAGPLAGYKQGIYEFQGEPALVTKSMKLLEPQAGEWPTLYKLFENVWNDTENGYDQRTLLFGHWAHALESLHSGNHSNGLALAMAGEHKSGKSLTAKLMVKTMGYKFAQPYAWMIGQDNFNEEISEATILLIDDENANTTHKGRLEFGAKIKQIVAVPGARIRGLHQKATTLLPIWRLVICLNTEPDRIMVLPSLDDDIRDKLLILRAFKKPTPMPSDTQKEQRAFMAVLEAELPAFVHYLLNEFTMPEHLTDRFGVSAWCHPEIERSLSDVAPEAVVDEFIERYFKKNNETLWSGTAAELRTLLLTQAGLTYQEQDDVEKSTWLGRRLGKLVDRYPEFYEEKRTNQSRIYTVRRRITEAGTVDPTGENWTRID